MRIRIQLPKNNADPCGSGSATLERSNICGVRGGIGVGRVMNKQTDILNDNKEAVIFTHLGVPAVCHRLILVVLQPKQKKNLNLF
jgi:hypothetical protein